MSKKELTKRYVLFVISLYFTALGVACTKYGELGVSPISSVANIFSLKFSQLSIGNWLIIWCSTLVLIQVIILKKKFPPIQFLQILIAVLFGYFTDFGLWSISFIPKDTYAVRLLMVFLGVVVLGFGIALAVIADVLMNPGEAVVKVVADVLHQKFGNVKTVIDISCVTFSMIMSLIFFDGKLVGTREGTVIAALCTGFSVKFFQKCLQKPLDKMLKD